MNKHDTFSRRDALSGALVLASSQLLTANAMAAPAQPAATGDFDFLTGSWRVEHHQLKDRLAGASEWWDFSGTTRAWPLLGGDANLDDNELDHPKGSYRAITLRRFDPNTQVWSIWWLDHRFGTLDPPMKGAFKHGVGTFFGEDQWRDKPIRVRFIWSNITASSARWEQAFSPDQGASWETNWVMNFRRSA
jgi:hypothetical protein